MGTERFRNEQIKIWTTKKEKSKLRKNMKQSGYGTMNGYLLKMGLEGVIINIDFSEVRNSLGEIGSVRNELNRIGSNINQIAKHTNDNEEIDVIDFYLLQEEVVSMKEQIVLFEKNVIRQFNRILKDLGAN